MKMKRLACQILGIACLLGTLASAVGGQPGGDELVAQGKAFLDSGKTNEAIWAYRQAAKTGNLQGILAAGEILFQQGRAGNSREQVLQLAEGLGYLFVAATNRQPQACVRLAEALENGVGVQTNLVRAYAWLQVAAQTAPALKADLDRLVIRLEPEEILQAQKLGREYFSGHWPAKVARPVDQGDSRLQVQGVSVGVSGPLVILNGDSLAAGETISVPPAKGSKNPGAGKLTVSCCKIGSDYLLVSVSGEPNLKLLALDAR